VVFATSITKENGHWGKSYYCCCCRHMHSSSHSGLNLYFTCQDWLTPLSCQCMEMFMTISWSTPASLFVNLVPPCSLTFQHHMVYHLSWVESANVLLVPVELELVTGERSLSFGSRKFKTVMVGSSTHDWLAIFWVKCSIFSQWSSGDLLCCSLNEDIIDSFD